MSKSDSSSSWLLIPNVVVASVGLTASTGALMLRIYTKIHIMHKFWLDDVFMIITWICSAAVQSIILYGYGHAGYGVHVWELSQPVLNLYLKTVFFYINYLHSLPRIRQTCAIDSVLQSPAHAVDLEVHHHLGLLLALIFACNPIGRNWDIHITTGSCINRIGLFIAIAATNTASDVVLILIPIKVVWGLHLPPMQKLGIILLFTMGGLTTVISIVRLATVSPLLASSDQQRQIGLAGLFVIIEANSIILCGCLIFFRQFLRFHAPTLMGDHRSIHRSSQGSSQFGNLSSSTDISWPRNRWSSFSNWYHRETAAANTSNDIPEMVSRDQDTRLVDAV